MRIDDFLGKEAVPVADPGVLKQQVLLQDLMAVIHFLNAHYLDEFPTPEEKLKALHGDRAKLKEWTAKNKAISVVEEEGHAALGDLIDNQLSEKIKLTTKFFSALQELEADKAKGSAIKKIAEQLKA